MPVAHVRGERLQVVPFAFSSGSPMFLRQLQAGQVVEFAHVLIETPFSDPSARVQVGTSGSPGAILASADVDTQTVGQYNNDQVFPVGVSDILLLTITPGTSTQGSGLLMYQVKE